MLLLVGGPGLLQPQGFRSWEEGASRDNQAKGVTVWAPGHSLLVTPGLPPGLCVLAYSDFPGGAGMHFPRPQRPGPARVGCMCWGAGGGSDKLLRHEGKEAPTCSRPFSEAFLRGGQITASFPSPLIAVGKGTLSQGSSSSHQLESARIKEAGRAP